MNYRLAPSRGGLRHDHAAQVLRHRRMKDDATWDRPALAAPRQTGDGSFYFGLAVAVAFLAGLVAIGYAVFG